MISNERVVNTGAVPANTTKPLPPGANNIYSAGTITQQNQAQQQATSGGKTIIIKEVEFFITTARTY